jgi:hypothetical protein
VREPVCAEPWQPISFVRHTMLENSFSFLPIDVAQSGPADWRLVSDFAVASYLRAALSKNERKKRLGRALREAWADGLSRPEAAVIVAPSDTPQAALDRSGGRPVLVVDSKHPERLLGILTPFDFL